MTTAYALSAAAMPAQVMSLDCAVPCWRVLRCQVSWFSACHSIALVRHLAMADKCRVSHRLDLCRGIPSRLHGRRIVCGLACWMDPALTRARGQGPVAKVTNDIIPASPHLPTNPAQRTHSHTLVHCRIAHISHSSPPHLSNLFVLLIQHLISKPKDHLPVSQSRADSPAAVPLSHLHEKPAQQPQWVLTTPPPPPAPAAPARWTPSPRVSTLSSGSRP